MSAIEPAAKWKYQMNSLGDKMSTSHTGNSKESAAHGNPGPSRNLARFVFERIGPVKKAELELGNLTIIAGRNNTGKSYIVYTLYGFLKMWNGWPGIRTFLARKRDPQSDIPTMSEIANELVREGEVALDSSPSSLEKQRKEVLRQMSRDFSNDAISQVFSSQSGDFDDASIAVEAQDGGSDGAYCHPITYQLPGAGSLRLRLEGNQFRISLAASNRHKLQIDLEYALGSAYLELLLGDLFPAPFILSAERFGISLFYRELDFTKNQLVDLLQKVGKEKDRERYSPFLFIDRATNRYALPIKDNIDYTRSLPERRKDKSELYSATLFNDIRDMMGGYFSSSGDEFRFISKARGPGRSFNVPLHLASSSARGLSDLYFFLRHVAKRNHLLIIDEPESHLDTANQIKLARLLARLVRAGLKVLLTTHSDYLIKEINNLIMLDSDFEGRQDVIKSLKYTSEDAFRRDSVRAYVAKDGELTACEVDKFGIDMPLFDKTINDINTAANELASHLEA